MHRTKYIFGLLNEMKRIENTHSPQTSRRIECIALFEKQKKSSNKNIFCVVATYMYMEDIITEDRYTMFAFNLKYVFAHFSILKPRCVESLFLESMTLKNA